MSCEILLNGRGWGEWRVGNVALCVWREKWAADGWSAEDNAWISREDLRLALAGNAREMVDESGEILARRESGEGRWAVKSSVRMNFPWDMLKAHEFCMGELEGGVAASAEVDASLCVMGVVEIGEGARILPGVVVEGFVTIGAGAKVGPNCYLSGKVAIGAGCRVGQGVEIKNSVLGERTNVAHLSYVGDSILGSGVNVGGGTIFSNFRHDGCEHRAFLAGTWYETGREKWGAVLGDGARTGIQTAVYPGRMLAPGEVTLPGEVLRKNRGVDEFLRMRGLC